MSDTCAEFADIAEKVIKGEVLPTEAYVSPRLARAVEDAKCSSAAEFKARRMFFAALSRFRSDVQDAAALSHAFDTALLRFLAIVGEHAPSHAQWDAAMVERAKQ